MLARASTTPISDVNASSLLRMISRVNASVSKPERGPAIVMRRRDLGWKFRTFLGRATYYGACRGIASAQLTYQLTEMTDCAAEIAFPIDYQPNMQKNSTTGEAFAQGGSATMRVLDYVQARQVVEVQHILDTKHARRSSGGRWKRSIRDIGISKKGCCRICRRTWSSSTSRTGSCSWRRGRSRSP